MNWKVGKIRFLGDPFDVRQFFLQIPVPIDAIEPLLLGKFILHQRHMPNAKDLRSNVLDHVMYVCEPRVTKMGPGA